MGLSCGEFAPAGAQPTSSSDNAGGEGANLAAMPKTALSSESSLESKTGDKEVLASGATFGGIVGESPNISIRLRGLGRAGEYACIILWANGFATGKGCRIGTGVAGLLSAGLSLGGETSTVGGESQAFFTDGSSWAGGRAGPVGSDARGDGGGRTKEVGRREDDGAKDFSSGNTGGGINSVS